MNALWYQIFSGIIRAVIAAAGGYGVAKGVITADTATQLTGALGVAAAAGLSAVSKVLNSRQ